MTSSDMDRCLRAADYVDRAMEAEAKASKAKRLFRPRCKPSLSRGAIWRVKLCCWSLRRGPGWNALLTSRS